ncbi:GGDEF-domain containing protein [Mesorhizobium sp. WSM4312]|uniref:putative bifunctional diguanylate cyclase/phosphodiesterase n=1 Tax=unclassified Mesorhizobium TaxID=325217 RepID=UPI000BAFBF73|nr:MULTISPECIES: bifunctional diguanylate cyclase/phosphodiesterase [unclassified Mesorhizobium]PBB22465.1 GGDEF-domain containing protein [Mesorhizobium sp. WSM4304]PBB66707.1 GGDEF-domain containing protein [Mesorhizobium sp. WSM4312]PBB71344.1 GGDEF-domain containing protein [Mesorhizobium sp. WSM4308]PBC21393.1 GGDEF-domain containing protein [Mesorhizobium sp. WSM4311]TRC83305.1 bifunctional diguanylate cyclase/phosphodiesterase [Mesorhizobium sp. WSM4310]
MANTTELLSFYDRDFQLTHHAAVLKGMYGGAVAPGAAIWEIYPSFLDSRFRDEFLRVFQGGTPANIDLPGSPGKAPRSVFVFGTANGVGIIESRGRGGRSAAEEQEHVTLLHQATHDVLTGLQNRRRFGDRLQLALAAAGGAKPKAALLQIDLDDFKAVNDTLGHGAGDTLLQLAAGRIRDALQDGESAYRYAGDEFAVIQLGKDQPAEAERLAGSLVDAFKEPFVINGISVFVGSSIGIAFGPEHGTDGEQLMKAADIALYAAKTDGRGCARTFNRSMLLLLEQRENLRRRLRTALERDELYLEYQPLIRSPASVTGFEALLRWRHPEIGIIPPSVFIPIAEADGLMDEIGRWVLEEACRQALTWPSSLTVAVNLSPAQFLSGSLTDTVAQIIDAVGIRADRLELEITETVLLEKTIDNIDTLNTLNVLGIRISLDDFGTYYSSLSYLKNFPFDTLKIDQYFIADLDTDLKSQTIVRSIINLAHGLGISVTAEGVETSAQARWLIKENCDSLQGNFLGRPLGAEATGNFIRRSPLRVVRTMEEANRAV